MANLEYFANTCETLYLTDTQAMYSPAKTCRESEHNGDQSRSEVRQQQG